MEGSWKHIYAPLRVLCEINKKAKDLIFLAQQLCLAADHLAVAHALRSQHIMSRKVCALCCGLLT